MERYDDVDLNGVTIDAHRIPEILSSLVKHYRQEELETLIQAVDPEGMLMSCHLILYSESLWIMKA